LAARASKELRSDELLVAGLGSTILRKHLDHVPLRRGDHVLARQLVDDFARYLYLPRVAGPEVLAQASCGAISVGEGIDEVIAHLAGQVGADVRRRKLRRSR